MSNVKVCSVNKNPSPVSVILTVKSVCPLASCAGCISNIPVRDKVAEFTKSLFVKLILKKILSFSKGPEDINDVHC